MSSPADTPARVSFDAAERRAVGTMALVLALRMFGLFMLIPVLALYASDLPGATPALAGLAVGAFGIAQAALQLPAGLLSDRIGRKAVIVLGLAVFAAGSLVAAEATTIAGVLAGRMLQGAGAISAAATALVADLTRGAVRTRAMAVIGIAIGASFMLALGFGAQLAVWFGVPGLFMLGAGLALVSALLVIVGPGGFRPPARTHPKALRAAMLNPELLPHYLGIFVLHAMLTATFVSLPFLLRDTFALAPGVHTKVYLGAMIMSLLGTVPLVLLIERSRRPGVVFMTGVMLVTLSQAVLAFETPLWGVFVALTLFFAGFNFIEARLPARVSQLAGDAHRGAALGAFATGQYLGAFTGGALGGLVLGTTGPRGFFVIAFVLAAVWLVSGMVTLWWRRAGVAGERSDSASTPTR